MKDYKKLYRDFLNSVNRKAYHAGEFQWEEDGYTVTRTYHYSPPGCHTSCGLLYYVKDNKVEKVEGDPLDPCANGRLCMRCLDNVESFNHPDRLKYPMKRIGERGENKWQRITWDEAYDTIEKKVREIWAEDPAVGGASILVTHGTGRNINWQVPFFAHSAFFTPNVSHIGFGGFSCYLPRVCGAIAPLGDFPIADASETHEDRYANEEWEIPGVIVVWGNEPLASNADGYLGHWLAVCHQMGSKIISIDPRVTWWGARADYHLQLRPGTDAALACAWLHVIIKEKLYDEQFIDYWCCGFDELAASVEDTTPAWAAKICEVSEADIIASARLYATTKPATIQWGLAFDQQVSAMALNLAACDLMAITGNVDVPGGNVLVHNAFEINGGYAAGVENIPPEWEAQKLTNNFVLGIPGADFIHHASSDAVLYALETGKPYPIKMWWVQSANELSCPAMDAPRLFEALKKVPFIVNADPYLTPTSVALADILLPVAMASERNSARTWWTPVRTMSAVTTYFEAKQDEQILVDLGHRLNPEAFPWTDALGMINNLLNPRPHSGGFGMGASEEMTDDGYKVEFNEDFHSLQKKGGYKYDEFNDTYRKYEKGWLRADGSVGFVTPSGRIELTPTTYKVWGLSTTPHHAEPLQSPVSTPEDFEKYPLILTNGGRSFEFFHSEHRQLETMREFHPWPLLTLHPEAAEKYGVRHGEWVWIENGRGRFRQVANVRPTIRKDVVHAEHAWWFPEEEPAAPHLFGTFDSNPNNLTRAFETGEGGIGNSIKAMLCKIYPCKEGDIMPGEIVAKEGGFNKVIPGQPN